MVVVGVYGAPSSTDCSEYIPLHELNVISMIWSFCIQSVEILTKRGQDLLK